MDPASGAAANGFGRNWLQDREARLLHKTGYPCPPHEAPRNLAAQPDGAPGPPTPTGDERLAEIYAARERLTEEEQADPV